MREKDREGERKEDQELRRFVALCEKQSNKVASKALCKCAAGSHNVCDAPLCGCMSKHFTCPLVAQRFEGIFHVFVKAKTFHFSAERKAAQTLLLYLPKNFTSVAARHAFAYRYCRAVQDESIWITQRGMAELFGCTSDNISLHLKNIYADGELSEITTTEDFSVVQLEGSRQVTRSVHTLFNAPQAAITFAMRRFAAV